ncbi:hypothetical protein H6P81_018486 [Aristolochia fimbriata]|uniref:Uncharacterized protein n=1 Tax=Aristolochia fimbriata TaxID=158543 RepID=A0AAV7E5B7_ARIFI|nr:hypothetical protein H6P81_018486 [Aristolochia fimbriata]
MTLLSLMQQCVAVWECGGGKSRYISHFIFDQGIYFLGKESVFPRRKTVFLDFQRDGPNGMTPSVESDVGLPEANQRPGARVPSHHHPTVFADLGGTSAVNGRQPSANLVCRKSTVSV